MVEQQQVFSDADMY